VQDGQRIGRCDGWPELHAARGFAADGRLARRFGGRAAALSIVIGGDMIGPNAAQGGAANVLARREARSQ